MVRVTEEVALSPEHVTLYHASDPLLGHLPVLIFHGSSTTANYTLNSSRVQIHIFSPAGFHSFPRLTISPNSPHYNAVHHLPRELQGDEVYRALAFGLYKYFTELPDGVKTYLKNAYPTRGRRPGSCPTLFGEQHTADLVKSLAQSDLTADVISVLSQALQTQHVSNVDLDLVLPPGAVVPLGPADLEEVPDDDDDILDPTLRQYGGYTPLVKLFGEPVFLPTSRLRRAPSKPTSLNRGRSFNRDQKVELRMKLNELVDTEERYVAKLEELVHHVSADFRQSAHAKAPESLSPSEAELDRLFPQSAGQILKVNTSFLEDLRQVMDDSEADATQDMDLPTVGFSGARLGTNARAKDPTGALAIARLFLDWFPRFTACYQDYIKASQHFPTLLNSWLDQQSSFKQRVAQKGEQGLRSVLIEPVQRLPRYSLLIDQIVASLPITHPALQPMLKARDVITNICSMDEPVPDKPHVASRLRHLVEAWPAELEPQGRLILATDVMEVDAPFQSESLDKPSVFLLFTDCLVVLRKVSGNMTGRELLREVDKPSAAGLLMSMTNAAGGPATFDFCFTGWHNLADVRFTHSLDNRFVWMTSTKDLKGAHSGEYKVAKAVTSRCFLLADTYEGRAAKWDEDVVKARIEARFSEKEREDPCWTLRSVRMPDSNLGLHAAVFQEGADQLVDGRREPAPIRVVVDHEKGTKGAPVGHYGVEVVISLQSHNLSRLSMVCVGLSGKQYHDEVLLEDFLPTLSRRIIQLMSSQHNVTNPNLTAAVVSFYSKILRTLAVSSRATKTRSFLNTSPVKLLSSFWGQGTTETKTKTPSLSRNNSQSSLFGSVKSRDKVAEEVRPENPLVRLEQTFTGYVAALQSRKGAIIGRTLLNRSMADELSVNDLYNRLIGSPFDFEAASAQLSTEVIFVAFEKFLHIAWTEQMGPVMSTHMLDTLQARANKRLPGDFADFVNFLFRDMAPQNCRAFTALVKLLADLLDGCGNDSDRGALTLTFAELLVADGHAHNYINLLDRLVEDVDRIFEDPAQVNAAKLNVYESMNSKSYAGSITSNASSLRRKFGLEGLLRQNSKDGSVWRSLSKHRNPATGESSSLSKATVARTRSIDDNSIPKRTRPGSRDRPPIVGAFESRPTSSQADGLETIGEPVEPKPRRKRRSSLSDLKSLMAAVSLDEPEPVEPEPVEPEPLRPLQVNKQTKPASRIPVSPNTRNSKLKENAESPTKLSNIPTLKPPPSDTPGSPTRSKLRLQSPQRLRERLQTEKKAAAVVDASLRSELHRIGEEMAKANTHPDTSLGPSVKALQEKLPAALDDLRTKQATLEREMDMTVKASEAKVKAIDQLYKEAVAENELLYERFNGELGKLVRALKGKGREDKEELLDKLKSQGEETARLKKENAKLKREMVSLRAALKADARLD